MTSGLEITAEYGISFQKFDRQLKEAEQRALASAQRIEQSLSKLGAGGTRTAAGSGASQITAIQAVTRAQQSQTGVTQRLDQLNERLTRSQLQLSLAQNTGAARVRVLSQDYDRLEARTREAGLAQDELTRRQIAATQAATRLQTAQNALNRGTGPALPRTFAGFTGRGALEAAGALGIATGIGALTQQLSALGQESVQLALQAETIGRAYQQSTLEAGIGAEELLARLKEVSRGTVSESNLQLSANKALALGVGESIEDIASLLAIARQRGKDFGVGTEEAFRRIVEGIGKAEPEILDELGILLDSSRVYKEYAASIGVSADELTKKQKVTALTNDLITKNTNLIQKNADAQIDAGDRIAAAEARRQEATARLGRAAAPVVAAGAEVGASLLEGFTGVTREQVTETQQSLAVAASSYDDYVAHIKAKQRELVEGGDVLGARQLATSQLSEGEFNLARAIDQQAEAHQRNAVAAQANAAAQDTFSTSTSEATTTVKGLTSALTAIRQVQLDQAEAKLDAVAGQMSRLQLEIRQAEAALGPWEDAVESSADAVEAQKDAIERAENALEPYRQAVAAAGEAVDAQREAIDAAERALRPFQDAVETASDAVDAQRRAIEDAEAALQPYRDAIDAAQDAVDRQNRAIEEAERALRPYEDAVRSANRAVEEQQRAIRDAEAALKPYQNAVRAAQDAVSEQQRALDAAERALQPYRDAVESSADAVERQQRQIELAERALRPYEEAVRRAQQAEEDQTRAIERAERALRPYQDAVEAAQQQVEAQTRAISDAERALRPYEQAVKDSQKALDAQSETTDRYKQSLDEVSASLDEAKRKQSEWTNVPLQGSKAFSDQLFAIDQETAKIQKQLLELRIGKKTTEPSPLEIELGKVNDQVQATALHLAKLRDQGTDDAGIKAAEAQYQALRKQQDALSTKLAQQQPEDDPQVKALEEQLQSLADKAEGVRLDEKLKLDPLRRQMEQLGQTQQEMSFEDIVAGYQRSTEEVDTLTGQVATATTEWEQQQAALDEATAAHERNQAALEAQQDAIEPLRLALEQYQENLTQANDALAAQDALIDPLRDNLVRLKDATQAANDELERQQDAIQPLRDQLVGLQDNLYNAQLAFDAADAALDPMRQHLDDLNLALQNAQLAFDNANRAIDPMRETLAGLQGVAETANDALRDQQDLITPLKDALIPLNDALRDANEAYKDANELIDPMRDQLGFLEGSLRDAQDALEDQEKAIRPLRDRLDELERSQRAATAALEDADKLIEPHRQKLDSLERAHRAAEKALDDEREKIGPLRKEYDALGLRADALRIDVDEATKALKDAETQVGSTATAIGKSGTAITKSVEDTFGTNDQTGIRGTVYRAGESVYNGLTGAMGTSKTTGVWGVVETANTGMHASTTSWWETIQTDIGNIFSAIGQTWDSFWGVQPDTGLQGKFNQINFTMRETFLNWWGRDDTSGIRGDMTTTNTAMQNAWDAFWGVDKTTGLQGSFEAINKQMSTTFGEWWGTGETGVQGRWASTATDLKTSWDTFWGTDGKTGIRGFFTTTWEGTDGEGGIKGTIAGAWDAIKQRFIITKDDVKNAILSPFELASGGIGTVMMGFGDNAIDIYNKLLTKMETFVQGVVDTVNWISGKILGKNVIEFTFEAPQIDRFIPLAKGTDNWQGGWARTGEQGRELAILPGGSSVGNPTYLPPGAAVLPNQMTEKYLRSLPGFATGLNTEQFNLNTTGSEALDPWALISEKVKSVVDFILNGPMLVDQVFDRLGFGQSPDFPGVFGAFNDAVSRNLTGFGTHAVFDVASGWLRSNLPAFLADPIIRGIQGGYSAWQFFTGNEGQAPGLPEPPASPGGGAYPTGIGLDAALNAIIQGGFISGYHFSAGHKGIDIASRVSDTIHALIGGRVISAGYNPALEGQYIVTEDAAGRGTYYGHMVPGSEKYARGDDIGRGSVIGTMGSSGAAEGKHIHFEMRINGSSVNPEDVFSGKFKWPLGPDTAGAPGSPQPAAAFWPGTPANAQQWVMAAIQGAGVGADWIHGMSILGRYESGWDPTARNLNDSNYPFHPSRGITQTIPETFNSGKRSSARTYQPPYSVNTRLPGQPDTTIDPGDIYNPIENIVASVNYIKGRYGHVNNLRGVQSVQTGGGWIGYANGGLLPEDIWGMGRSGQKYKLHAQELVLGNDLTERLAAVLDRDARRSDIDRLSITETRHPTVDSKTWNLEVHQHGVTSPTEDLRRLVWVQQQLDPRG